MNKFVAAVLQRIRWMQQRRTAALVEKALGFKLYEHQKAYIFNGADWRRPGRCTGKTTAHIIHLCLSEGEPIQLWRGSVHFRQVPDEWHGVHYLDFYRHEVRRIYEALRKQKGLKLRKIVFTNPCAQGGPCIFDERRRRHD